jgi:RNA polymerase sigma factor (sigma-70 family)
MYAKLTAGEFRSTLEEKWHAYLCAYDLKPRYEPVDYRIPGLYYQPDFAIDGGISVDGFFVQTIEVKPLVLEPQGIDKVKFYSKIRPILMLLGYPDKHFQLLFVDGKPNLVENWTQISQKYDSFSQFQAYLEPFLPQVFFSKSYVELNREHAAWKFVECYRYTLIKMAAKYTKDWHEAGDIVSEASLYAVELAKNWNPELKLFTSYMLQWMYWRIGKLAIKSRRQRATKMGAIVAVDPAIIANNGVGQQVSVLSSDRIDFDAALADLRNFDSEAELVFREHYLNGISQRDIALKYRCHRMTVSARLATAKSYLSKRLQ